VPRVLVPDKLASYGVAHRRSKYLNNRAEKFPSADPAAGTSHETLHFTRTRATIPLRVQRNIIALSATSSPARR
jgi:hypothetical protein